MEELFGWCRDNKWKKVLECVNQKPRIGNQSMTMDNDKTMTIIYQAIRTRHSNKEIMAVRAHVIVSILVNIPEAAQTKTGNGNMPLHTICETNVKMDPKIKENLIYKIIEAFPKALMKAN
jgi:hypothetical protein